MAFILVVDDDEDVRLALETILTMREHYTVETVADGAAALAFLEDNQPDLIILDIIMPQMDGLTVCKRIRNDPFLISIPILFLTAKGRISDITRGLDAGADDYLPKPYDVEEMLARVRALLRRNPGGPLDTTGSRLKVGGLTLERKRFRVHLPDGTPVDLTSTEHHLLYTLMLQAGQPISIDDLLEHVWGYPAGVGDPSLVHVHIRNLRHKLESDPKNPQYILNVYGRGYLVSA